MNILLVSHRLYKDSKAGTEVLVEDTAYELKRRGHTVIIMAVGNNPEEKDAIIDFRDDGIICISLSCFPQVHSLDNWKSMEIAQTEKIRRVINNLNIEIDIVHVFHFLRIGLGFFKLSCFRNSVLIMTLTDYSLFCPDYQLFDRKKNCICRRAYDVTNCVNCLDDSVTPEEIDLWREYNLDFVNSNASIVYNQTMNQMKNTRKMGICNELLSQIYASYKTPTNWIHIKRKSENRYDFAFMGRISPEKGLHILLKAFKSNEFISSKLLICGDYDDNDKYSEKIKSIIAGAENITHLRAVPLEELGNIMACANCLLFPSIWDENHSLLLTNACAIGMFVICSYVPSLRELKYPQLEFVKEYENPDSWREAMRKHLERNASLPEFPCVENFMIIQHGFYTYMDQLEKTYFKYSNNMIMARQKHHEEAD